MKKLYHYLLFSLCGGMLFACTSSKEVVLTPSASDLVFADLAATWDEAMPLGNATVGALVWQRDSAVRFSLDRIDLWDLRPMPNQDDPRFSFRWVYDQVQKRDYKPVQEMWDKPYGEAAPSKIPGAALEFDATALGEVDSVRLYLNDAVCVVRWKNGARMLTFVDATRPVGWFRVTGVDSSFVPSLLPPKYEEGGLGVGNSVDGMGLLRLGYRQGAVTRSDHKIVYHQQGWEDFYYDAAVAWQYEGDELVGVWSLTNSLSGEQASEWVDKALKQGFSRSAQLHQEWWNHFWAQSSVRLPDPVLQKQYDNEMYKLGSVAREDSYPISLQAVWTADNGNLPPWKGDYHHDLNTQLSYWPVYTGNHLTEGLGYLNTLWAQREENMRYTRTFYGTSGVNVPGVCDLLGKPMGGWIQYSFSPTISAWLSQHFYLHWLYSADPEFLRDRAYPYMRDVAVHLDELMVRENGKRKLPLSSSPEINDNRIDAWFHEMTNYDLALTRFVFTAATEMASELQLPEDSVRWTAVLNDLPEYALDEKGGLSFAPNFPYTESHRHFSHLMAIHPLGLIDKSNGPSDQAIIDVSLATLDHYGPDWWVGYSYSWLGNMKARALDAEGAVKALRDFANHFCLRNTFHANGDQTKSGMSKLEYRPFTLEGNFAFASGVQELLLQSHTGTVVLFPAVPSDWKEVGFTKLRARGAFVLSADRTGGEVTRVEILSERGRPLRLKNPFGESAYIVRGNSHPPTVEGDLLLFQTEPLEMIVLERK